MLVILKPRFSFLSFFASKYIDRPSPPCCTVSPNLPISYRKPTLTQPLLFFLPSFISLHSQLSVLWLSDMLFPISSLFPSISLLILVFLAVCIFLSLARSLSLSHTSPLMYLLPISLSTAHVTRSPLAFLVSERRRKEGVGCLRTWMDARRQGVNARADGREGRDASGVHAEGVHARANRW